MKIKFWLLILINSAAVLLFAGLFQAGFVVDVLLSAISLSLSIVNYMSTKTVGRLAALQVIMTVCATLASRSVTQLYYRIISSDQMSLVVGDLGTLIVACAALFLSAIVIIVRAVTVVRAKTHSAA